MDVTSDNSYINELTTLSDEELRVSAASVYVPTQNPADGLARVFAEALPETDRKNTGAVFTPYWMASRLAQKTLAHWKRLHRTGKLPKRIHDASCGCGAFLLASQQAFGNDVIVSGTDKEAIAVAFSNLLQYSYGYSWEIALGDSLLDNVPGDIFSATQSISDKPDILIGNPPYVRSQNLDRTYAAALRTHYRTMKDGNADLSVAFLEHAIDQIAPDGICCYLVPNKLFRSRYGKEICAALSTRVRLLEIEDYHDWQIFPDNITYTCALFIANKPPAKRFLLTRFPAGLDANGLLTKGETETLPQERLLSHPWAFATGITDQILSLVHSRQNPTIESTFRRIRQGIRTGANEAFIVKSDAPAAKESLTIPYYSGEHITGVRLNTTTEALIFPYRSVDGISYAPVEEIDFRARSPKTYAHLAEFRSVLSARSIEKGSPWYAFSRSQNLDVAGVKKILVREMLPKAVFAADLDSNAAFSSGYALDVSNMTDDEAILWACILSTPTMEFVLRHSGTQLHSGWFRLLKHHLQPVPLPKIDDQSRTKLLCLSKGIWERGSDPLLSEEIDLVVSKLFGLSSEHRKYIHKYLTDCHERSLPNGGIRGTSIAAVKEPIHTKPQNPYEPIVLSQYNRLHVDRYDWRRLVTFQPNKETPIFGWYKYTQAYSKELVDSLIDEFGVLSTATVLDPFSGAGTTGVTCAARGISSVGIEISPLMTWVANVKAVCYNVPELRAAFSALSLPDTLRNPQAERRVFGKFLSKAFSPKIINQIQASIQYFKSLPYPQEVRNFFLMAVVSILEDVSNIRKHGSHYRFMLDSENIGLAKLNIAIVDPMADIRPRIMGKIAQMLEDLEQIALEPNTTTRFVEGDARHLPLEDSSIDFVITSPPYLNRNNYISQQKAELDLLGLVASEKDYKRLVLSTFRSHTDADLKSIDQSPIEDIQTIVEAMTLNSGNNKNIPKMIIGYFNDLALTIKELYRVVKSGGRCAFVVGNTRWGGIVVPVDHLLAKLAEQAGFRVKNIYITRHKGNSPQQMKQFGKIAVRESVVVFSKQ